MTRWVAAAAVACVAAAAVAREEVPVRPGARVFGELDPGGELTVAVVGAEGMRLDMACVTWRGDDLVAQLTLEDPDGVSVDLAGHVTVAKHGLSLKVRTLVLAKTGTYHLTVAAAPGTSGGFDLVTRGARPTRLVAKADAGPATIGFPALDGDAAALSLRAAAHAHANVVRYVDAAGTETAIGRAPPVKQALRGNGTHVFDVTSDASSTWRVVLHPARADRTWLDAADLVAEASVSGTIAVGTVETGAPPPPAAKSPRRARRRVQPGDVIVAFAPGKAPADAAAPVRDALGGLDCSVAGSLTPSGPFLVRVRHLAGRQDDARRAGRTRALVRALGRRADVAWAECNDVGTPDLVPNDTLWPEQDEFVKIRMPDAWDVLAQHDVDGSEVVVAFVDNGIVAHPDVGAALLPGYDFVSYPSGWDSDPTDTSLFHHGILIAGVLGAVSGNQLGIAGVIPKARLVPVRTMLGAGGLVYDSAAGIRWAAGLPVTGVPPNANPARVINCSFRFQDNMALRDAVRDAVAAGVLVVASAGNDGNATPTYPASLPGVVSVGALADDLTKASYSTYGDWVTLWAPGTALTTTATNLGVPTYEDASGTSLSAPQVAGVAALMFALNPELTAGDVVRMLKDSAAYPTGLPMLDAARALEYAAGTIPPEPVLAVLPRRVEFGRTMSKAHFLLHNVGTGEISLEAPVTVVAPGTSAWLSAATDVSFPARLPVSVEVSVDQSALPDGVFEGALRAVTTAGTIDVPVRVVRTPPPQIGFVRVRALRPDGSVAGTDITSASAGWRYTIPGLRRGTYELVADTDADGTLAVDRVDEWSGAWPLPGASVPVEIATGADLDGYDFGILRYDARFVRSGVGGGSIQGAIAVRVTDAVTYGAVPGARVYVADGVHMATTGADGRAVVTGDFVAGQTVTVVADGYATATRIGSNAQFQAFALQPDDVATTDVAVLVDGLAPGDADVDVSLGDGWKRVTHDGSGTVSAQFTLPQRPVATPAVAVARDAAGVPSRAAFAVLDATLGRAAAALTLHAGGLPAAPSEASVVVRWPDAAFESSAQTTTARVGVRWSAFDTPRIGGGADPQGASLLVRWTAPPELAPSLGASLRVTAGDASGRMSSSAVLAPLGSLAVTADLVLPAPPVMSLPFDGAAVLSGAVTLKFDPTPGSQFQWITLRDTDTGRAWVIETRATIRGVAQVVLPELPERPVLPGHTYTWTVRSAAAPGLSADDYRDEDRAAATTDTAESAPRTFTTQ